jgi:hypothetical protein
VLLPPRRAGSPVAQAFSLRAQPERPCYFRLVAQGLRWRRLSACAHSLKGWAIFARPRAQSKRLSPEMATHLLNVVIELESSPALRTRKLFYFQIAQCQGIAGIEDGHSKSISKNWPGHRFSFTNSVGSGRTVCLVGSPPCVPGSHVSLRKWSDDSISNGYPYR